MSKKVFKFLVSGFAILLLLTSAFAADFEEEGDEGDNLSEKGTGTAWFRFCFWPGLSFPDVISTPNTNGVNFGISTFGDEGETVGLDMALGAASEYVKGAKIAFVTKGRDTKGFAGAIFNIDKEIDGVQFGLCNEAEKVTWGVQIGLINEVKKHSEGYQIGLINLMENGYFEAFPFFNFPKSDDKADSQAANEDF